MSDNYSADELTQLEDALTCLRSTQATMMKRYEEMKSVGVQDFTDMPNHGPALLVMVDEDGELLSPSGAKALAASTVIPTHNTDEAKEEDALRGEAQMILSSIARLGRAAGCHLVIATQRPDATLSPR